MDKMVRYSSGPETALERLRPIVNSAMNEGIETNVYSLERQKTDRAKQQECVNDGTQ